MKHSIKVGLSFGLTSGVITTLGLMMGLYTGTQSELAVISGILTIAIADAMSDALGIHMAEESENVHTPAEIWVATIVTFLAKFFITTTFVVPIFLFPLQLAVYINVAWGILVLGAYSVFIAIRQKSNVFWVVSEHVFIALLVIILSYYAGEWINRSFG